MKNTNTTKEALFPSNPERERKTFKNNKRSITTKYRCNYKNCCRKEK